MLSLLYFALLIYICISGVRQYKKERGINYFTIFCIYYGIYYIIPAFVINTFPEYIGRYPEVVSFGEGTYAAFLLIIVSFLVIKFSYNHLLLFKRSSSGVKSTKIDKKIINGEKRLINAIIVALWILGIIALIIHSISYGGLSNAIINSALIRDNMVDIEVDTGIGIFSIFTVCLLYASYLAYIQYLNKDAGKIKLIISFILASIYLIIHAGRGAILTFILTLAFIATKMKKNKIQTWQWLLLFIIVVIGINYLRPLLVSLSDLGNGIHSFAESFANRIAANSYNDFNVNNLIARLCYFVEHKYISLEQSIISIRNGQYSFNYFTDVIMAILTMIPTFLLPFEKPKTIAYYNTGLIKGFDTKSGAIPPGGVAYGYYALGPIGVIIYSLIIGSIGRRIGDWFNSFKSNYMAGLYAINMLIWIDFFINGEMKESLHRYFIFLIIIFIIMLYSKKNSKK